MSFTLRISGTAFEQKLVGFKDVKTFKEKLKNQNDEFFYEILDEETEDTKEISHHYDPAELLATLIDLGSESISKYSLTYNEDGGCSNRTISGYFLDQNFNEVD